MKKRITSFLLILLILLFLINLCSCGKKEYTVLSIAPWTNLYNGVTKDSEITINDNDNVEIGIDTTLPKTVQLKDGTTLTGNYKKISMPRYNAYPSYYYVCEDGATFCIDDQGTINNLASLNSKEWTTEDGYYLEMPIMFSEDEYLKKATDYLSFFVDTPSDYTFKKIQCSEHSYSYYVFFTKIIGDFETTESITINVGFDGHLRGMSSMMLDKIPMDIEIDFDMEAVDAAVMQRLNELYEKNGYDGIKIEYGEPEYLLTLTKSGDPALICNMKNTYNYEKIHNYHLSEQYISFFVAETKYLK